MIDKVNSPANIESMLQVLRQVQDQLEQSHSAAGRPTPPAFTDLVRQTVAQVNEAQLQARATQGAYERGEEVPLTRVVLEMQKSSLAFEATLQVRNKVLKAYEDILNMPV
jgi:flagellar hook-basal body complex protein FliE